MDDYDENYHLILMESLILKETDTTPNVIFDINKNVFEISGSSHPENPLKFFNPILAWLEEYGKNPSNNILLSFKLEYFNSSTAKYILNILWAFEKMTKGSAVVKINVNWYYKEEDLDAFAAGERYAQLTTLQINLIKEV